MFAIFTFAPSSQPLPLRRNNLLRSETSRRLGIKTNERVSSSCRLMHRCKERSSNCTHMALQTFSSLCSEAAHRGINEDLSSVQGLVSPRCCWFVMFFVRTVPFLQLVTSQLASWPKFSWDETFADGHWSMKTAKVFIPVKIIAYIYGIQW